MYQALIEKTVGHETERAIREFPSEISFLRALDRVEEKAYSRNVQTARFDTALTVMGKNGEITFRPYEL